MKLHFILLMTLTAVWMVSCANDSKKPAKANAPVQSAVATGVVHHYICPKNCEGSGSGDPGACPVCGSELLHNDAFHNQGNNNTGGTTNLNNLNGPQNPQIQQQQPAITPIDMTAQQPSPEATPAQNAAGVYHYICSRGCAGGSGTAGNCATCGNPLAHNAAYHQ